MTEVEQRVAVLESQMADTRLDIHETKDRIAAIDHKIDKFAMRPTWAVTTIIGALSAACASLGMLVAQLS